LRSFAVGEMGWTLERYFTATLTEYILASEGYWKRWERNTAWPTREIIHTLILISPYIKKKDKPSRREIMTLSIDKKPVDIKQTQKAAKEFEDKLKHNINGKKS